SEQQPSYFDLQKGAYTMKPLHLWAAAALLLLVAVSPALANAGLPDNKKVEKPDAIRTDLPFSHMTIESVAGLREARLQVPRTLLKSVSDRPRDGSVRVEVVEDGYEIKLLVPAKEWKGDEEE